MGEETLKDLIEQLNNDLVELKKSISAEREFYKEIYYKQLLSEELLAHELNSDIKDLRIQLSVANKKLSKYEKNRKAYRQKR